MTSERRRSRGCGSRRHRPWSELLAEATTRFERAGLESPATDARRIVEEVTGSEPSEFHRVLDTAATVRGVASFDRLVAVVKAANPSSTSSAGGDSVTSISWSTGGC